MLVMESEGVGRQARQTQSSPARKQALAIGLEEYSQVRQRDGQKKLFTLLFNTEQGQFYMRTVPRTQLVT